MAELDTRRTQVLGQSAIIIQSKVRSYFAHKRFNLLRCAAIQIQTLCRGNNYILCFLMDYLLCIPQVHLTEKEKGKVESKQRGNNYKRANGP